MPRDLHPLKDGIEHINVYTKGSTMLGRALSNLSDYSFEHPLYGHFRTVEGFWYYALLGYQHDDFRELSGFDAKALGKEWRKGSNWNRVPDYLRIPAEAEFRSNIRLAVDAKIEQNSAIKELLRQSHLPLVHYYWYGNIDNPNVKEAGHQWLIEHIEGTRNRLQQNLF